MIRLSHHLLRSALFGLLALALASLPFAHRAGAAPLDLHMAQFAAMGGTAADLCGDKGAHSTGGCESCRIAAPMLVPGALHLLRPLMAPTALHTDWCVPAHTPAAMAYATPPVRGPPPQD